MNKNKKIINELKKVIIRKSKIRKGTQADNIKLGDMGSWAELPGNCDWYIPELGCHCKGTCGEYCNGCFNPDDPRKSTCYVFRSIIKYTKRNDDGTIGNILTNKCSVKLGHAYRTLAMTMFRDDLFIRLNKQLCNTKKKFETIRINESGELTCYEDLYLWIKLAILHPETVFYLYTKNFTAVRRAIIAGIPSNLFINISVWHEYGIDAYTEMCGHPQIRAFVLVDDIWTREKYLERGLNITTMCGAYDEKGRMNHDVTCAKCKKCFSHNNKCCGCYEH